MATITFNGASYTVNHAVKGDNFVHGYDAAGVLIVAIEGITNFTAVSYDGSYMSPDACAEEPCNKVVYCNGALKTRGGKNLGSPYGKNLLYNWYFANPVNQQGKKEYTTTGYTIDRWYRRNTYGSDVPTLTLNDDSINFRFEAGNMQGLNQPIDPKGLVGKTLTLSVLFKSVSVSSAARIGIYGANSASANSFSVVNKKIGNNLFVSCTGVVPESFAYSYLNAAIVYSGTQEEHGVVDIIAAKLELGDKQTFVHQDSSGNWVLNEIPDYAEQMAICKQYNPTTGEYIGLTPAAIGAATLNSLGKVVAEQSSSKLQYITSDITLDVSHAGKMLMISSTNNLTVTLPTADSAAFPEGTEIEILRWGTGGVTISPASGVYMCSVGNSKEIADQYGVVCLKKVSSANDWLLAGALA